jgi:hypothetical protein
MRLVLRRSWNSNPERPASAHAFAHALRKLRLACRLIW